MESLNLSKQKYTPINGVFYEMLESAALHNDRCEIVYTDEEGNVHNVISRIDDLYTQDGVEYALLEDDKVVRLDQIKSLNGELEAKYETKPRKSTTPDFGELFYNAEGPIIVGQNDFYKLTLDRLNNLLELRVVKTWESMEEISDLKSQLIQVADFMLEKFGLLIDLTGLLPNEEGVLESPFIPARGILLNAGLVKVADLIPESCNTIVHNRGSFSVNSIKLRSFKERYFAENWLTER